MKRTQLKLKLRPNEITYLETLQAKLRLEKWKLKYEADRSEYNLSMLNEAKKNYDAKRS